MRFLLLVFCHYLSYVVDASKNVRNPKNQRKTQLREVGSLKIYHYLPRFFLKPPSQGGLGGNGISLRTIQRNQPCQQPRSGPNVAQWHHRCSSLSLYRFQFHTHPAEGSTRRCVVVLNQSGSLTVFGRMKQILQKNEVEISKDSSYHPES